MDEPESHSDAALNPASGTAARGRPWGFWATIGWTLLIIIGYLIGQGLGLFAYFGLSMARGESPPSVEGIENDGMALALATIFSAPLAVGLSLLFAWLRKGITVREYLALNWPGWRTAGRWILILFGFVAAGDVLTTVIMKRSIVPEVMVEIYQNTSFLPLLWFAMMVAAPAAEEFIFRGFLFVGLRGRGSPLGNTMAILVTSVVWASIHVQYDLFGVTMIFFSGILLGLVRLRTDSLPLCILLHLLANLISTVETEILRALAPS